MERKMSCGVEKCSGLPNLQEQLMTKVSLFLSAGRDFMIFIMRVVWMQWRCISNKILRVVFSGKGLILGGSHAPNYNVKRSLVGDLSAILIENVNPLVNLIRVPDKKIALLSDFEEKVERITRATMNQNVTNLSGVPSWMMAVLKHILEVKGTDNLAEVWPDLEVFFMEGLLFTPYREQYKQLIRSDKMHYMETYNASEGFFGLQK